MDLLEVEEKGGEEMEEVKVWKPTRHEIQVEKMKNRPGKKSSIKRFVKQNRDIVTNLAIVVVVAILASLVTGLRVSAKLKKEFAVELQEERFKIEQEVSARVRSEYGADAKDEEQLAIQKEAETLAKMLYPMQYNSDNGLKSACWCALNRVSSQWYPNTVYDVCAQEKQWMGWSEDNPVIERLYKIALDAATQWHSGIHAVSSDFLFLDWNTREITLRTTFEGGRGCHYWYEEDWENE